MVEAAIEPVSKYWSLAAICGNASAVALQITVLLARFVDLIVIVKLKTKVPVVGADKLENPTRKFHVSLLLGSSSKAAAIEEGSNYTLDC